MKTLQNHTLIFDKDCPMCDLYSKSFTKCGMLDENGREAFSEISESTKNILDFKRARNEIALVNTKDKKVTYGLDSLLLIIGHSFPILQKIAEFPPFYWFFKKCYAFVSYNRKQIIPSTKDDATNACVPDFNLKYRLSYIIFVLLFSTFILSKFNRKMFPLFNHECDVELFFGVMLIIWQIVFLSGFLNEKIWDYIGNMMTVSLLGTLLLLPTLFFDFRTHFYAYYFVFIFIILFLEHFRRIKILKIGFLPLFSYVVFSFIFGVIFLFISN